MKKHRHVATGDWFTRSPRVREVVAAGLVLEVAEEQRGLYPRGEGPACCTETRTVLRLHGDVTNERALTKLVRALAEKADTVKPVVRR